MGWTGKEVRKKFLDFFEQRGHKICPSYPLVPPNDPTLMFTNAGMVQFKDVFTGKETKDYPRAATVQKCIRISGKHNDLDNVGRTSRHHTFFEMLGNFSFGDYFKAEACRFAWDLITEVYALDKDRLWVSVHSTDDEAFGIWRDEIGLKEDRIFKLGDKDNFWSMGETGPCGPCSEILYDRGDAFGDADPDNGERYFELWNLVFMQYQVDVKDGPKNPLPKPSIDTGAGLERIVSVLQGVDSNYDTDLFKPLLDKVSEIAEEPYGQDSKTDMSMRVIADHARMTAFSIAEGIFPDRNERPYVLRRVMRRAILHGHLLDISDPFLHRVALSVVDEMGDVYPELREHRELIEQRTLEEEKLFRKTLERGIEKLQNNKEWIEKEGKRLLPGRLAHKLHEQDGFPKDLFEIMGAEQDFELDEQGWSEAEEEHKLISRGDGAFATEIDAVYYELKEKFGPSEFVGYVEETASSDIVEIIKVEYETQKGSETPEKRTIRARNTVKEAKAGEDIEIIVKRTPCYGESGGQVGDQGILKGPEGEAQILDTQKPLDLVVHVARVDKGVLRRGDQVTIEVDHDRRLAIRRNHSATHLLHWALREVLGKQATQSGSVVAPDFLRFDFSHGEPLTDEQLRKIEDLANQKVLDNSKVNTEQTTLDDAKSKGAMSLFGEKYSESVRMVQVSPESIELCGGTHTSRSGDVGLIKISRQESVGAGIRRIYATTGTGGLDYVRRIEQNFDRIGRIVKEGDRDLVPNRVEKLDQERRKLKKEVEDLKRQLATGSGGKSLDDVREIDGINVMGKRLPVGDGKAMMEAADTYRDRLGSGVALLGAENGGKVSLVMVVTKDLIPRLDAVDLIRRIAPTIGARGGGGRPDLARTGGPHLAGLDQALTEIYDVVASVLTEQQGG